MNKLQQLTCGFLLCLHISTTGADSRHEQKRWYTPTQVAQGKVLYSTHCAKCHGDNAEATPDWRKADAEGFYPPPPLNGTAHAWHHLLPNLRQTIRNGGAEYGGKMPPFKDRLSIGEVDAVIAWFQSLWPDETYERWVNRGRSSFSLRK